MFDAVPNDWFTTKKKQVFVDSGIKITFVGSPVLAQLVEDGYMDEIREVLEKSDPEWKAVDSIDAHGRTILHLAISQGRPEVPNWSSYSSNLSRTWRVKVDRGLAH